MALDAVGLVWLGAWFWLYESPDRSRRVSAAELAYLRSDPPEPELERVPRSRLLGYRQTWVFVAGYAFTSPI